ncbi:sigma-54-dependent Fis family transcriptional regulator [Spiribacter halobius]|uniref:Sigma-54-dependent Fis family transcriptional regulator n=2 Tax=Sediminicurvatus halobius TaxID=2182432 RepID=A0A2U2N0H3_9GAMM|nr:sigma-54-dependent Fis family transcriptional regulator [Spiribacter halobius]
MDECLVIVDRDGIIRLLNQAYGRFLGVDPAAVTGRPVTEVIENTRMHIVARSGRAEVAQIQLIQGRHMIASRYPILDRGRPDGAIGIVMYRNTDDLWQMNAQVRRLVAELDYYREAMAESGAGAGTMIGESAAIEDLRARLRKVAAGDATVLIRGESGTGKELCARALHAQSNRASGPFIAVNCAALPEELLEAELFGYEPGAFTGARRGGKPGRFQLADGGTLFLDEIGDMPPSMQVKLLRVLQSREVEPVGGTRSVPVDVRILAATHRPLERLVSRGQFREDLFYRINVVPLDVPPLRERPEDIPLLVEHVLARLARRMGRRVPAMDEDAMALLRGAEWPGNVRELENAVEAAFYLSEGDHIGVEDLPGGLRRSARPAAPQGTLRQVLDRAEREAIEAALRATGGNRMQAARQLAVSKSTFYEKLARHGIRPHFRSDSDDPERP